jgi:hypothetical protein
MRHSICSLIFCAVCAVQATAAQPTNPTDYAVFSNSSVQLTSYSTVLGPVYSGGNLTLNFGYGIQRPPQNAGDFYARGNFVEESLSEIAGNVFANNNVTLNGSARVNGNVVYGNQYIPNASSRVTGSVTQQPNSVAAVSLPPATTFTPGLFDFIRNTDFTLPPGSYGVVEQNGSFKNVRLSSGTYYMRSLSLLNSTSLYLDFTGFEPIKVYVQDDIFLDSGFDVFVNNVAVGNGNVGLQTGFAGLTLFETHGDFSMDSGFLSYFYGTIFAPNGSVSIDVEDMFGSILAGGPITGNGYISLRSSQVIPEPSTVALLGIVALVSIPTLRRFRMRCRASTHSHSRTTNNP